MAQDSTETRQNGPLFSNDGTCLSKLQSILNINYIDLFLDLLNQNVAMYSNNQEFIKSYMRKIMINFLLLENQDDTFRYALLYR